jgi:hypothetical protein
VVEAVGPLVVVGPQYPPDFVGPQYPPDVVGFVGAVVEAVGPLVVGGPVAGLLVVPGTVVGAVGMG